MFRQSQAWLNEVKSVMSQVKHVKKKKQPLFKYSPERLSQLRDFFAASVYFPTSPVSANQYKCPAGKELQSSEKMENFYMDNYYQGWKKDNETCVIPLVPKRKCVEIPNKKNTQGNEDYRRGDLAEEEVQKAFKEYGKRHAQPMFIFHGVDFTRCFKEKQQPIKGETLEGDVIIVHRNIGIILVEIKSTNKISNKRYYKPKKQLKSYERFLKKLCQYATRPLVFKGSAFPPVFNISAFPPVFNISAFPNLKRNQLPLDNRSSELYKDDLCNFDEFWKNTIGLPSTNPLTLKLCYDAYCILIPKLVCGRKDICLSLNKSLNIKVTTALIHNQEVRKKLKNQETNIEREDKKVKNQETNIEREDKKVKNQETNIEREDKKVKNQETNIEREDKKVENQKTNIEREDKKVKNQETNIEREDKKVKNQKTNIEWEDKRTVVKEHIYLTPKQWEIWDQDRQVICGPLGSGKTMLLQWKAAFLAKENKKSVLVIVPLHLKPRYMKFFKDRLSEDSKKKLQLISRVELYEDFDKYKAKAESSHVFIDELLWLYPHKESPIDNDYYEWNIHFFELLKILMNENNSNYVWIAPHLFALMGFPYTRYPYTPIKFTSAVFLEIFLGIQRREKFRISTLTEVMRTTTQINDFRVQQEQDWLRISQQLRNDRQCLEPIFHKALLTDLITSGIEPFIDYIKNKRDQQVQNVPCGSNDEDIILYDELVTLLDESPQEDPDKYSRIVEPLFKQDLGHFISGLEVNIITYPNNGVHNKAGKQGLHHFFAKVLKENIEDVLKQPRKYNEKFNLKEEVEDILKIPRKYNKKFNPFQPSEIAIIKDCNDNDLDLDCIKELLQDSQVYTCSVTEQDEGRNAVAICDSSDIASLEWPVVFHVSSKERSYIKNITKDSIYPSLHGESLIITRTIAYYTLICVSDGHYMFSQKKGNPVSEDCDSGVHQTD